MGSNTMRDYRFDYQAYGLRKNNPDQYAFSRQAARLLAENDETSLEYSSDMWEEFWEDLLMQYSQDGERP